MEVAKRGPGRPRKNLIPAEFQIAVPPEEPETQEEIVIDDTPYRPEVRRMNNVDLARHAPWLLPKLQERFKASLPILNGWIRTWITSNEYNFACTDTAVGLAYRAYKPCEPAPAVEEVFFFSINEDTDRDKGHVYNHFLKWAKSFNAYEFRWNKTEKRQQDSLKAMDLPYHWRSVLYVDLTENG